MGAAETMGHTGLSNFQILGLITVLALTGCATGSGIVPSGPDTFTITERRAPVLGGSMEAKKVALTEANEKCRSAGASFFPVSEAEGGFLAHNPFGNTDFTLTFQCKSGSGQQAEALPLTETNYRIIAKGNSSLDEAQDLVLFKAAQIALSKGYHGFTIDGSSDRSVSQDVTLPGTATMRTGAVIGGNASFAAGSGTSTMSFTPPSTATLFTAGASVYITLVQQGGYDARLISDSLSPKYGSAQAAR